MKHENFFESLSEARMRLRNTVVLYDGEPFHVLAITDHRPGNVFSIYLQPLGLHTTGRRGKYPEVVDVLEQTHPSIGPQIDEWMTANPESGVLRKNMDSSYFNKFRPFPLGMCNHKNKVYYVERQPLRPKTEQGLTSGMMTETLISASGGDRLAAQGGRFVDIFSPNFRECVLGNHPSASDCLTNLLDPKVVNDAHAFHRYFAFVRGPIGMIFVAYKEDVVAVLPSNNLATIKLGRNFGHLKEVVEELGVFVNVLIQN